MQTSLRGIANKANKNKKYRFLNLYTMLNYENLIDSWKYMNLKAASGIDKQTAKDYENNLKENVEKLVERLKAKKYRAKLIKRVYIPKANGKMRPLGVPALEDKLVQTAAARILNAIFQQDFLPCSYVYRQNRGANDAVNDLDKALQFGNFNFLVEADIKGFFDNISHEWLIKMLEQRISDKAFIGLIRKWLRAGVLDTDGQVIHPITGSPQGGIVSPILANVYLHYVLDIWFVKVVNSHCKGKVYLSRFADDFVCAFENKNDAERFYSVLPKRLEKFGLEVAEEKTQIITFSRNNNKDNGSFEYLGFRFQWKKSRKGNWFVNQETSKKKFRMSVQNFKNWCKSNRSLKLNKFFDLINAKLRGYYNYYGVVGNSKSLCNYFDIIKKLLYKWLNRRSQRTSYNWETFNLMLKHYGIELPRITKKPDKQLQFDFV